MRPAWPLFVVLLPVWLWFTVRWNRIALRNPHTEGEVMMADFSFLMLCAFILGAVGLIWTGAMW